MDWSTVLVGKSSRAKAATSGPQIVHGVFCMKPRKCLLFAAFATAILSFCSCSGTHNHCTTNCNVNGDASLSLTLAAVPFVPPPSTSILSFVVTINSVSLTPSAGGSDVNVPLNNATYVVDLTRLESDSVFLGQAVSLVPTGTYNQIKLGITSSVVTSCAATSGTPGCNPGSVAQIATGPATPTTSGFTVTLASNEQAGLRILINMGPALTVNSGTQGVTGVSLAGANVLSAITLPPASSTLSSGQLDYLEDVTGVVTAASSSSITVETATRGSITSAITNSTIGSPNCVIQNQACTAKVGQIASLDATLNSDGTSSLLEFDPLSNTSADIIEGIVTTSNTSTTQFQVVTNEFVKASSGSLIGGLGLGDPVNVTLVGGVSPFVVDTKGLPIVNSPFVNSTSATDILPGQTVALRVTGFTAKSGATPASAQADFVVLRFTRVAGNVSTPPSPNFSIQLLPGFFGLTAAVQAQTSAGSPSTYLDGYSSTGAIPTNDNVAIRALYFGATTVPAFNVAKVRKN
jgi:hypothetical protein